MIFDRPGETLRLDLRRARLAWEIACCWRIEPARAARLARALQANEALTPRQIRPLR